MEKLNILLIEHLATAILTPIGMWLVAKYLPLEQSKKQQDFDYLEMEKLSNKRLFGCFFNFFLLGTLLTVLHYNLWLPLYEYLNKVDNIVLMSKPTLVSSGTLAFYLAFPLSIILTKYSLIKKYGIEKATQLDDYYSVTQNINNSKAEKWLLNSSLFISFFLLSYYFSNIAIVTDKYVHYSNPFSILYTTQAIDEIIDIAVYEGIVAPNGNNSYHTFYKVSFKNNECWKVTESEKFKIVLYLAETRNITIENKGIEP